MNDNFNNNDPSNNTPFIPGQSLDNNDDGSDLGEQMDEYNLFGSGVRRKRFQEGTVLIITFLFIACGLLISMRWFSSNAINISRDDKVESKVNAFISVYQDTIASEDSLKHLPQADIMVNSLTNDRTNAQVPLDQIKMNPFVQHTEKNISNDLPIQNKPGLSSEEIRRREREKIYNNLSSIVDQLQLNSIVGGPGRYIAQLGNNIVQLGDTTEDGQFTISDITSTTITLENDGFEFVINLRQL